MDTIIHKKGDGGVARDTVNPEVLVVMMGDGIGWDDERIAYEAGKFTIPSTEINWPGFPLASAQEWTEALGKGGLTEAQTLSLFARRTQLYEGYTVHIALDSSVLPYHLLGNGDPNHGSCFDPNCQDRYFRDALVWDGVAENNCRCDMPRARIIHMNRIRLVRDQALAELDVLFMLALEAGDLVEQQKITEEMQSLRDIPQTFDLSKYRTPNTLKASWPSEILPLPY